MFVLCEQKAAFITMIHLVPKCDYKSTHASNLKAHIKSVHDNVQRNACPKCDYMANQTVNLKQHIKLGHDDFGRGLALFRMNSLESLIVQIFVCSG